ncbi:hypothetical protein [Streptomyces sp. NRRL F-5630]|nr:hypothetical protein [Streptomyces sp. NRRL F-5630]
MSEELRAAQEAAERLAAAQREADRLAAEIAAHLASQDQSQQK